MKIKKNNIYKILFIILLSTFFLYVFYDITRPTIIFHTYQETGYLGKVIRIDGDIDKLYLNNYTVKYKLPHLWKWNDEDEIAIFTHRYNDLISKKDVDFWKLEIYLDKKGYYKKYKKINFNDIDSLFSAKQKEYGIK